MDKTTNSDLQTLNQMFKSEEIIERKIEEQTMQWPNDKGQTMQWRNEKNSKHSEKHYSSYHTT